MSQLNDNIDPSEVAKFEDLASGWWDEQGKSKPLHQLNPIRTQYIMDRCELVGSNIIDVGCGGGILSEALAKNGANVTGIDMAEMSLQVAKLHALEAELEIDYRQITAEQMAHDHPQKFDVVTCLEMLEHVPEPYSVIEACARLVKPGGQLFFSTLNRHPKAYLMAIFGAEYVMNMLPKGTHEYKRFIKPSELAAWCREAGLHVNDIRGMSYNPLSDTFSLSTDIKVNYLVHCQKR